MRTLFVLVSSLACLSLLASACSPQSSSSPDSAEPSPDSAEPKDISVPDGFTSDVSLDADATADTDGGGSPPACVTTLGAGPDPAFDATISRFEFKLAAPTHASLLGSVYDGQAVVFHQEAERSGACRLLTGEEGFCDPPCESPALCTPGGCALFPTSVSVGELTLTGVPMSPVTITADALGTYYWLYEGHVTTDEVSLSASGEDAGAFQLTACTATAPIPQHDWSAAIDERAADANVTLTWSNPVPTARIYLRMTTGIGTHGGVSPVEIECEGPDTGSLTLPSAYLDALYAQGWSCGECGGNVLWRYHANETEVDGRIVQFRASAGVDFWYHP